MTEKTETKRYKFFYNGKKYEGDWLESTDTHVVIYDYYSKEKMFLPLKETTIYEVKSNGNS